MLRVLPLMFISFLALAEPYDGSVDPDEYFEGKAELFLEHDPPPREGSRSNGQVGNFGSGMLIHSIGSGDEAARAAVIQTDGKIVVAGRIDNGTNNDFLIVRTNADGSLDTSFFSNGHINVSFGNGDDLAHGMSLQTDGKLLVVGRSDLGVAGAFDFAVARLNGDGSLDTTFNSSGKKTVAIQSSSDIARAVDIDSSSNFSVIAGYSYSSSKWDAAVIRLKSDGQMDTAFNSSGKKVVVLSANDNGALGISVLSSSIAITGPAYNGTNWDFGVARLTSFGSVDTTFHSDGLLVTTIGTANDRSFGVIIDTSNRVLAIGEAFISGQGPGSDNYVNVAVVRYLSTGVLDTTFMTNGLSFFNFGTRNYATHAARLMADGKILVGGGVNDLTITKFHTARLRTDGMPDGTYGDNGGFKEVNFGSESGPTSGVDVAQALAMRGDGYVVAAGRTNLNGNWDIAIVRYNTDGTLARAGGLYKYWGTGGYKTVDLSGVQGTNERLADLKVQTDGKLVAIPQRGPIEWSYIIRYNLDGSLDTTFNSSGINQTQLNPTDSKHSLAIDLSGRIVAGGTTDYSNTLAVFRFSSDGSFDTSFHSDGGVVISGGQVSANLSGFMPLVIQTDGKIIIAGDGMTAGTVASGNNLARFNNDGTLDTTYSNDGLSNAFLMGYEVGKEMALTTDGKLFVVGWHSGGDTHLVLRYNTNGTLDTSFNTGLQVYTFNTSTQKNYSALFLSGGQLLIGADNATLVAPVLRINYSGALDTSFASDGLQSFGELYVSDMTKAITPAPRGQFYSFGSTTSFHWSRWASDGTLDTTFNSIGYIFDTTFGASLSESLVLTNEGLLCGGGRGAGENGNFDLMIICRWQ